MLQHGLIHKRIEYLERILASNQCAWALVALGLILRLVRYLHNPTLWTDEASLAYNILSRSVPELFDPLILRQQAPTGFLLVEKYATLALGTSEYALRLFPLVCGLSSVVLFFWLVRCNLKPISANVALFFFATSNWLIYYTSEVKSYSVDVCLALLVILLGLRLLESGVSKPAFLGLAVVGILAPWFSYASVLILSGTGIVLLWRFWRIRAWPQFNAILTQAFLWAASFAFQYLAFWRVPANNPGLQSWFSYAFPPFPPLTPNQLFWYPREFFAFFNHPGGFGFVGIATLLFLLGIVHMARRNRPFCALLTFPWVVTFVAALAHKYPFTERLVLFLVPSSLVLIGDALGWVWGRTRETASLLAPLICALLAFHPSAWALNQLYEPHSKQELRPIFAVLNTSFQEGDVLYVYHRTWPAFHYYQRVRGEVRVSNAIQGDPVPGPSLRRGIHHHSDLLSLRGSPRVWVLLTHFGDEERHILGVLDSIGLRVQEEKAREGNASLYLYDLSPNALEAEHH